MKYIIPLLLLSGCLSFAPKNPPPILAQVAVVPLDVHFQGAGAEDADLYVCGFVAPNVFSCLPWALFEKQRTDR